MSTKIASLPDAEFANRYPRAANWALETMGHNLSLLKSAIQGARVHEDDARKLKSLGLVRVVRKNLGGSWSVLVQTTEVGKKTLDYVGFLPKPHHTGRGAASRRSPERHEWQFNEAVGSSVKSISGARKILRNGQGTSQNPYSYAAVYWNHLGDQVLGPRRSSMKQAMRDFASLKSPSSGRGAASRRDPMAYVSKSEAKKTFYSGELTLEVRWMEGRHESPAARHKQVHGCSHNGFYRVTIHQGKGTLRVVERICAPAHLTHAVDSLEGMRGAAHAALSFASHEGHAVEAHAATNESGWHVGSTKKMAWPTERGERLRAHFSAKKHGRRDPGKDPKVYLSHSEGRYRVISQGVPISADKKTAAEALAVAHQFGLKVSEKVWEGDHARWSKATRDPGTKATRFYHVRYVHKISPRDSDVGRVALPDSAFSNKNTLASAMRKAGILIKGGYLRSFRTEGNRVVTFPVCPGLTTYWHSIILTAE